MPVTSPNLMPSTETFFTTLPAAVLAVWLPCPPPSRGEMNSAGEYSSSGTDSTKVSG